jgi:hypothetical protein
MKRGICFHVKWLFASEKEKGERERNKWKLKVMEYWKMNFI